MQQLHPKIESYCESIGPGKRWTHCCGHIVAHDVSWAAQNGKDLLRTQNVSEQNQKHFLCPGHKICIRNKCCARGQTGNICIGNNVSATMCPRLPGREQVGEIFSNSYITCYQE